MRKTYILHTLIICLIALRLTAAPRLTVVVAVDGLSDPMLEQYGGQLVEGGIQRLLSEGLRTSCHFDHKLYGGSEAIATLMTGTTPAQHNYCADGYFSLADQRVHPSLEDKQVHGICTADQLSPKAIGVPMLTDEMRIRYGADSKLYSLGLHPNTTILMAGHAAQGCCWLNPEQQKWATTTAYPRGLLAMADEDNTNGTVSSTLAKTWTALLPYSEYDYATAEEQKRGFSYTGTKYPLLTPASNELVLHLAERLVRSEQMGLDDTPDMLCLELTCRTPQAQSDMIRSAEQEDMLIRLNIQLGRLMDTLDQLVGSSYYRVVLVGIPHLGFGPEAYRQANLATHTIDMDRVTALMNTYLVALYGNERWVDGCYLNALFLNHKAITKHKLSPETIQRQVADLLRDAEGIDMTYTRSEFMHSPLAHTLGRRYMGDVLFTLRPLWRFTHSEPMADDLIIEPHVTSPVLMSHRSTRAYNEQLDAADILSLILR